MTAIFRILLVLPFGFIAACAAAGAILVLALAGGPDGWRALIDEFGAAGFGAGDDGLFVIFGGIAGLFVATFVAVPAFVVIVLAELFHWRSVFVYLAAGALIGLSGSLLPLQEVFPELRISRTLPAAAGLAGGFVYWLIAGRSAGLVRRDSESAKASAPAAPDQPQ